MSTPVKEALDKQIRERQAYQQHAAGKTDKSTKKLHPQSRAGNKQGNFKSVNRKLQYQESSECSEVVDSPTSESNCSESDEFPSAPIAAVGSWVLDAYRRKRSVRQLVGSIDEITDDGWSVKFVRRVEHNRFKWPLVPDSAEIEDDQVELVLPNPAIDQKIDRETAIIFKMSFDGLGVE